MNNRTDAVANSWNEWADSWYLKYRTDEAIAKIIEQPATAFHPTTFAMINRAMPSLQGKHICVPSSGDNHAVYAFHLLGANVTSCDISERQIENSAAIAKKNGWDIQFICDDTMSLSKVKSDEYDFVYTSNGVHVWIHDLNAMYTNIHRILKNKGSYLMFDIHPMMRPFKIEPERISVANPYDSTGPFGEIPNYKWRIQDIMNAMISARLGIKHIEEMFAVDGTFWIDDHYDNRTPSQEELNRLCDWRFNPSAALPQWLSILSSKSN